MSDDYHLKMLKEGNKSTLNEDDVNEVTNCVLRAVDDELRQMGASLSDFPDLPYPPPMTQNEHEARVLRDEIFEKGEQANIVNQLEPSLNCGQADLCEAVYQAVHAVTGKTFDGVLGS